MATAPHCAFCFETITASLDNRTPSSLKAVEKLWDKYMEVNGGDDGEEESEQEELPHKRPATKLQEENVNPSLASSGSSSTATSSSTASSNPGTPATSTTSLSATASPREAPMFVTWDTISSDGSKRLRGCIGTFEPYELEEGLKTYARIAAFEDHRFRPITSRELHTLDCSVTLLTDFEPAAEPMDWEIGKHGIRLSFYHNSRRYGSTYLPDVIKEQGWTKTEALVSLMRKAGWSGRSSEWTKVKDLKVIRYQGKKASLSFEEWEDFKTWSTASS